MKEILIDGITMKTAEERRTSHRDRAQYWRGRLECQSAAAVLNRDAQRLSEQGISRMQMAGELLFAGHSFGTPMLQLIFGGFYYFPSSKGSF